MPQEKKTAAETYRERAEEIKRLLDLIKTELECDAQAAAVEPANWSFAGSLGGVRDRLCDVLSTISGNGVAEIHEMLADVSAA